MSFYYDEQTIVGYDNSDEKYDELLKSYRLVEIKASDAIADVLKAIESNDEEIKELSVVFDKEEKKFDVEEKVKSFVENSDKMDKISVGYEGNGSVSYIAGYPDEISLAGGCWVSEATNGKYTNVLVFNEDGRGYGIIHFGWDDSCAAYTFEGYDENEAVLQYVHAVDRPYVHYDEYYYSCIPNAQIPSFRNPQPR